MNVKIKKLHPNAVVPRKAYPSDFCYDCVAVSEEEIAPGVWKYGLGFAVQIERGIETMVTSTCYHGGKEMRYHTSMDFSRSHVTLSLDLRARSSVWKTGMVLSNSVGTVDENYRGEISAVFYHVNKDLPRYRVGDRVAQLKIGISLPVAWELVDSLEDTDRGEGGYGSTGK